ncbi:hypothetical protein [Paraliomyxa miuraensis]|uniref:hypothetical protein n=1 Tax=Paraliomyxa miuraensis TaxID=376150 RepID=UPI0022509BA3|nr:hypothetical protein [Paraliomyxa miuraensis]MCX4245621.1 hypothetical protein [Paraliomyxa miuraensis]
MSSITLHDIQGPSGNWMRGCKCYCPAENEIMVLGESGMLAPGSSDETWYLNEVGFLRTKAELACEERVLIMQQDLGPLSFDYPGTTSCADSVADEAPYFASGCVLDDDICPGGGGGADGGIPGTDGGSTDAEGSTTDATATTGADTTGADTTETDEGTTSGVGGPKLYGLDDFDAVRSCPKPDACDVTASFVDDLLQDLSVLEQDAILVRPYARSSSGNTGFRFESLGADSLPAALGFQPGDLLWDVGGIELTDFAAVGRAFEELDQTTTLTARFDRDGATHRLTLRIVPSLDPG